MTGVYGDNLSLARSFYNFPPKYYEATYPNKGSPELASKIIGLLTEAGIEAKGVTRGLDHGVWAGFHVGRLRTFPLPK